MNLDTPLFRVSLSFAALWAAICAYLAHSDYRATYQPIEYVRFSVLEDQTYECFSDVPEWSENNVHLRKQTNQETQSCLKQARDSHEQSIISNNEFVFEKAWMSFLYRGIVPALVLLAVSAFWVTIVRGSGRMTSGYLNWLRFGSSSPKERTEKEEA